MQTQLFILFFLFVCGLHAAFQVLFYFRKRWLRTGTVIDPPAASIIICARNEAENLQIFLPAVLKQEYAGNWELIVVNDSSDDDTAEVLASFQPQFPRLRIVHIAPETHRDLPGKKFALQQGIAAAKHPYLLFTDADCKPGSRQWLAAMMTAAGSGYSDIMLGYGGYQQRGGLLNRFIRWETVHTCMQYCSLSEIGITYMGVGRNLLYKKDRVTGLLNQEDFLRVYRNTSSGDDDLTISFIARPGNTGICLHPEAHTVSIPKDSWKAWWGQKKRHVSTGKYYAPRVKKLLGLYALNHSLFWLLGIVGIWLGSAGMLTVQQGIWITACFTARLGISWLNAGIWYHALKEKKLLWFYPLGDLGWTFYNVILSPYIFWKNKQAWK